MKQQIPECSIHFLTKIQFLPVLANSPYIDKVHTISSDISEVEQVLKDEDYDFIVDLHNNLRSNLLKRKLKRPSATFPKLNFQKWLMVNFKINLLPEIHIVDRYFKAVKKLRVVNDNNGLDYFISAEDAIELPFEENNFVAFVTGAQHATKKLPMEKMEEIVVKSKRNFILLGGKEDEQNGNALAAIDPLRIKNYAGKIPLNSSAFIIRKSSAVISHDTGLMHIAAAFRKKIISVWGNTIPGFGMYPYMPGESKEYFISEVQGLKCRPCSKIGYEKCPLGHFRCMNEQDTGLLADRIEESF